ncbi:MAG: hypothetical protein AAF799_36750 [Myxococcota bacterium]
MLMSRLLSPLLASAVVALLSQTAQASDPGDLCLRQAEAVPGATAHHPEWWNPSLSESQREVRWTKATSRTEGDSAVPELARSRMIWDEASQRVFVEMEVNADTSIDSTQDVVVFALSNTAGDAPELFIQFQPLRGCSPVSNCDDNGSALGPSSINYAAAIGGGTSVNWTPLSTTNPSSTFTVHEPWVQVRVNESATSTTYDWTLRFALEVPVTSGSGDIRPNLHIYGNSLMFMQGPTSGTAVQFPLLCNNSSQTSDDCIITSANASSTLPEDLPLGNDLDLWPLLDTADPAGCGGVNLYRPLVGTDYNMTNGTIPDTNIPYSYPSNQIPYEDGAHFRAGFINRTDETVEAGQVQAEFRVANWGLQWSTWQTATWNLVETATLSGPVAPGQWAGQIGQGSLVSDLWVPADSSLSLENMHQCLHVRLRSNSSIDFGIDSVYRNMDMVGASVVQRPSEINLQGRKLPKGKKKHEVYLLVRSENMPSKAACRRSKNKRYGCAKGGALVAGRKSFNKRQKKAMRKAFNRGDYKMTKAEFDAMVNRKGRKGRRAEDLPFYAVHGMVDSGHRVNLPGASQTLVLDPFSAYGYYVEHEGMPALGWEHFIHGVQEVDPKSHALFKLDVAPGKVASIANTVRVLSKKTKACKVPPKPRWAVRGAKRTREMEDRIKADQGAGKSAAVGRKRVEDDQLGCEPPPLRTQCKPGTCPAPSPASFIEHSRYNGDWTTLTKVSRPGFRKGKGRKIGAGKKLGGKKKSSARPSAKKPSAKKKTSSSKKPTAKPSGKKKTSTSTRRPAPRTSKGKGK